MFTHFVSLPLAIYPELKKKLEAFRNSILGNNDKKPLKFKGTDLAGKTQKKNKKKCF